MGAIDRWKWDCGELNRLDQHTGELPEKYKITALKCILPEKLKDYIEEREDELGTYDQIENKVIQWAMRKRRDINTQSGPVPMDCGAVNQAGGDLGNQFNWGINQSAAGGKGNQNDPWAEYINSFQQGYKGGGKGGYKGFKGEQAGIKGGKSNRDEQGNSIFHGECWNCGEKSHSARF